MAIKVTFSFRWDGTGRKGFGASESHYLLQSPATFAQAFSQYVLPLAQTRVEMLAGNVSLTQVRCSTVIQSGPVLRGIRETETAFTDIEPGKNQYDIPATGNEFTNLSAVWPNSCLQVECFASNSRKARGRIFLAGVPDALTGTDPPGPKNEEVPDFDPIFSAFREVMVNGNWGFLAQLPPVDPFPAQILGWLNEEAGTGRLQFVLPPGVDAGVAGELVRVSGVKMLNANFPRPNGQYRIARVDVVEGLNYYTLRSTEGFVAEQIDEPGIVYTIERAIFPYGNLKIAGETTRKRGVGSVRPAGKSSAPGRRLL